MSVLTKKQKDGFKRIPKGVWETEQQLAARGVDRSTLLALQTKKAVNMQMRDGKKKYCVNSMFEK